MTALDIALALAAGWGGLSGRSLRVDVDAVELSASGRFRPRFHFRQPRPRLGRRDTLPFGKIASSEYFVGRIGACAQPAVVITHFSTLMPVPGCRLTLACGPQDFVGGYPKGHGINLVVGVIERDVGTLYCSVLPSAGRTTRR